MTLAAAAEGQIPEGVVEHLFRLLRRRAPQENFNLFINWLKHPSGPDSATISEFEVALTIARAIYKFVAVYKLDFGQNFERVSVRSRRKIRGESIFFYGHGQAETARKIAEYLLAPQMRSPLRYPNWPKSR